MNLKHFGDSYDIVKHSLLRWLATLGAWTAHPMFTEASSAEQARAFSALIGVPLVSSDVLRRGQNRGDYFAGASRCSTHLFLDPDTGLRMESRGAKNAAAYVFGDELVQIAGRRADLLTLVYDQSLSYGSAASELGSKLSALAPLGLHGFAYESHACFLLVGQSLTLVRQAHQLLIEDAHLPASRFVVGPAA